MISYTKRQRVIVLIAKLSGLSAELLLGHRRIPRLCHWRWIIWAVFRRAGYSYPEIGEAFHRDHSTILQGVKQVLSQPELTPLLIEIAVVGDVQDRRRALGPALTMPSRTLMQTLRTTLVPVELREKLPTMSKFLDADAE